MSLQNEPRSAGQSSTGVNSVRKAIEILKLFGAHGELGVTEIARLMHMAKGSVYRFLVTLKDQGLIQQNRLNDRYRPAVGLLELGSLYTDHLEWLQVVRPLLEELSQKTQGETIHLAVREGKDVIYIDKIEGKQALRMVSRVGLHRPAHCTGTGKALLAAMEEQALIELYRGSTLSRFTDKTITTLEDLLNEIRLVRERRYSVDAEENEVGIVCIGAVIRGERGEAIAAVSASGPSIRIYGETIPRIGQMLLETVDKVSKMLGWRGARQ